MSHNIKVNVYFGSKQFFDALVQLKHKVVQKTAYCQRLVASRLNLEFSFDGKKELITDGTELLTKSVEKAKDGLFTQEDADFAVAQLNRIGLVYNSFRTLYHLQVDESEITEVKASDDVIVDSIEPSMVNDDTEDKKTSEEIISEETLTSDDNVANITPVEAEKAPAKRGRKATK